jgi:hypothetical protein
LYQPNLAFKSLLEQNKNAKTNTWIITGNATDFNLLNQYQNDFDFKMSNQKEDYLAIYNNQFNLFALDNIGFEQFPPLENPFGTSTSSGNLNTLLGASIRNIDTEQPLLTFTENQGVRTAYLLGENCWKWRAAVYLKNKNFEGFDVFLDKTIQYLASTNSRKSLVVNHERFYNSGESIEITAQYFNKNYELDEKARLTVTVTNTKTKLQKNYDLLRASNAFKVNLDGLEAGNYNFTVKELNSNSSFSSAFEVLDFEIEKQFVNTDWDKLNQLANNTKGKAYLGKQVDELIAFLLKQESYKPIQKTVTKKSPLIDWITLLLLIISSLSIEWLVRKYNGLL